MYNHSPGVVAFIACIFWLRWLSVQGVTSNNPTMVIHKLFWFSNVLTSTVWDNLKLNISVYVTLYIKTVKLMLSCSCACPEHIGADRQLYLFFSISMRCWFVVSSHCSQFTQRVRTSSTHRVGGWVGLRTGMDPSWKGRIKISCFCWELNHDSSVIQPIA